MVITTLEGGLGNQLFMYAAARALSLKLQTSLVLNIETGFLYDSKYHRKFEMDCFKLEFDHNKLLEFNFPGGRFVRSISKRIGRNMFYPQCLYYKDRTNGYGVDANFFRLEGNVFLDGYWQSEFYFKEYQEQIRKDLRFTKQPSDITLKERDRIINSKGTPISVGVRRYQECADPSLARLTDENYYLQAMNWISERVDSPVFYVFTQDRKWVYEKLVKYCKHKIVFIEEKENSTQNDMFLMTQFQYHIICNSTFYWWGAWLANGHIVVSNNNFKSSKTNCEKWTILK